MTRFDEYAKRFGDMTPQVRFHAELNEMTPDAWLHGVRLMKMYQLMGDVLPDGKVVKRGTLVKRLTESGKFVNDTDADGFLMMMLGRGAVCEVTADKYHLRRSWPDLEDVLGDAPDSDAEPAAGRE